MERKFITSENDTIRVNYSAFSGKIEIFFNGKIARKISKRVYKVSVGDDVKNIEVEGNLFSGVYLHYDGRSYQIQGKLPIYVFILGVIPFIMTMVLGNLRALADAGFYYVGGAIGGGLSGLFSALGIALCSLPSKHWLRILILVLSIAITFAACYGIGNFIVFLAKQ